MRRDRRDRGRPIPVGDLQQIAKFRAELTIYDKLRQQGLTHDDALRALYMKDGGE